MIQLSYTAWLTDPKVRFNHGKFSMMGVRMMLNNRPFAAIAAALVVLAISSRVSFAAATFKPHVSVEYARNTNLFALYSGAKTPFGDGDQGDAYKIYEVGIDANVEFGRQLWYLTAQGAKINYEHFEQLNHNGYVGASGLIWKVGPLLDGELGYIDERRMVPFANIGEQQTNQRTQLLLETDRELKASASLSITSNWRVEFNGKWGRLETPRIGAPDLNLIESTYGAGFKYIGISRLSAGIEALRTSGEIDGIAGFLNQDYLQTTTQFAANYKSTGVSTFNGNLGRIKRTQPNSAPVSTGTWLLGYTRALTGKTSANIQLDKVVNSYLAADQLQSEVNSGVTLEFNWQATSKVAVGANASWRRSKFSDLFLATNTENRRDKFLVSTLNVEYQALRWLLIHPYLKSENRNSNADLFSFNSTIFGLNLKVELN